MGKKRALNIKPRSAGIAFLALLVPLVVTAAGLFDIADLSKEAVAITTLLTGLFLFSEIPTMGLLRGRMLRKDPLRVFGLVVALVLIVSGATSLFGVDNILFDRFQGIISILAAMYVISEAVRE